MNILDLDLGTETLHFTPFIFLEENSASFKKNKRYEMLPLLYVFFFSCLSFNVKDGHIMIFLIQ